LKRAFYLPEQHTLKDFALENAALRAIHCQVGDKSRCILRAPKIRFIFAASANNSEKILLA
jgi:hypothetical protein